MRENLVYKIYVLIDPTTNEYKYIGFTSWEIEERLNKHIQLSYNPKDYVHKWIHQLLINNIKPTVKLLEIVDEKDKWQDRERWWIAEGKRLGWALTNLTDGGDGLFNPSDEVRQKMSLSHKNQVSAMKGKHFSEKVKENMSKGHLGKVFGKNNPFFGKHHSKETKEKISKSHSGENHFNFGKHLSEEVKMKISKGNKGKIISEESKQRMSNARKGIPWTIARRNAQNNRIKQNKENQQ